MSAVCCWYELLKGEESFCREEQNVLLNELLSTNRTRLSLLRRAGLAMTGLEVTGKRTGKGGRLVLEFSVDVGVNASCRFKAGEPVKLVIGGQLLQSVVGTVEWEKGAGGDSRTISVSLSNEIEGEELEKLSNCKISLIKVVDNSGNFEKMRRNLDDLGLRKEENAGSNGRNERELLRQLRDFISGVKQEEISSSFKDLCINNEYTIPILCTSSSSSFSKILNEEQQLAVKKSIEMIHEGQGNNLFLIHGPPGTGKTSTLIEIIKQLLTGSDKRILVCGPSNLSVDNITEKLVGCGKLIVRLGHPSRVLETCQSVTLDHLEEISDSGKLLKDVQGEIDELVRSGLVRCKSREERRQIYGELKQLRQERRQREGALSEELLKSARVVLCTLSTAAGKKLKNFLFDVAVVDEAGQALLPEVLIAPLRAKKLLLAGDHFQLPPTVMNPSLKRKLERSLFEQLILGSVSCSSVMLKEQYRMNSRIMAWSNQKFYSNQLRAHSSVSEWKLSLCDKDDDDYYLSDTLIFYDTCGFDLYETTTSTDSSGSNKSVLCDESKFNEGEAGVVLSHYKKLLSAGLTSASIAVISPYSGQVSLIRDLFAAAEMPQPPEINSIDAFQGREKDVVILSLVRSNSEGAVGFLDEMRRINVAMTRAKKQLVIIGDSETLSRNPDLQELVRRTLQ